jgi:hypothetical protein
MPETANPPGATLGWLGFAMGAAALILTIVVFWAGPLAPQQAAGVSLGELAADIAKSAARSVAGQPSPPPVAKPLDIDDYLAIGVGVLAGLAIVIGVAAFLRQEVKRVAASGIALGGLAVGFQLFTWTVMMIVGGLVLAALVYALRDAFGDIFGGLFGG